jgi:hypothetical protein
MFTKTIQLIEFCVTIFISAGNKLIKETMKTAQTSLTNFAANYVSAQDEAATDMIESIMTFGKVSESDATKVFNFYIKKKWLKFDHTMRRYNVKSGNILDKSFIADVLEVA